MKKSKIKIVGQVKGTGTIKFSDKEQRQLINIHFLNSPDCNRYNDDMKLIPIEHENQPKVLNAHYTIAKFYQINVQADLTEEGNLINFKVVK